MNQYVQKQFLSINNQTLPEKKEHAHYGIHEEENLKIKEEGGGNPRRRLTAQMGFSRESQLNKQANSFALIYNMF